MNLEAFSAPAQVLPAKFGALGAAKSISPEQAESAARDFESVFLSQMLENMFGESGGEEAFGSTESNDIYKGLMVQEYGKIITKSGGIGIADYVQRELLKTQETGIKGV